jgi:hypothetical protein
MTEKARRAAKSTARRPLSACQLEPEPEKNGAASAKSAAGPVQGFNSFLGSGETLDMGMGMGMGMGIRVLELDF